jgi:RNAse (barnase) inhibitor barstar
LRSVQPDRSLQRSRFARHLLLKTHLAAMPALPARFFNRRRRATSRPRSASGTWLQLRVGDLRVLYNVESLEVVLLIVGRKVGNALFVAGQRAPHDLSASQNSRISRLPMLKIIHEIDGRHFGTLEAFYDVVTRRLIPGVRWGRNLDAFNDILRGGFGTPSGGFILRWANSALSRDRLGYAETVRQLEHRLSGCHPSNRPSVSADLERARQGVGPTVFDWLVEIIEDHCPGGAQQEDGVELILA